MSKKDTSLENIDVVKLLIFILIFVVVCLIMVFAFIVPNIKEYRDVTRQNLSQLSSYSKVKQIHDSRTQTLTDLKENNKFIIKSYDTKFDKDKFIKFASNYFTNVTINELEHSKNSDELYFLYELNVTSSVKTPKKFYDFLDALSKYESIIKAEFPIKMKGDDNFINTTFNIRVYGKTK